METLTSPAPATVRIRKWRNLYYHASGEKVWAAYVWPSRRKALQIQQVWFDWYHGWLAEGNVDPDPTLWAIPMPWPTYVKGATVRRGAF